MPVSKYVIIIQFALIDSAGALTTKGWFRDTLPKAPINQLALLRLDGDLFESTTVALNHLYDKVSPGGFIIVDDYHDFEPCRRAVNEFRVRHGILSPITRIEWTGVFWRKEN